MATQTLLVASFFLVWWHFRTQWAIQSFIYSRSVVYTQFRRIVRIMWKDLGFNHVLSGFVFVQCLCVLDHEAYPVSSFSLRNVLYRKN